ncbi:MAG: alpha/beta hydrolase [Planctomycetota bacterium]|nr:alpha/beta hydrolase [Planctomycetota bacterium]
MKPFHLQIQSAASSRQLSVRWFGSSAVHPEGSREYPVRPDALAIAGSDPLLVDLNPLLAEIAAGTLASDEDFQTADEFLWLRDVLAKADFQELCSILFRFLYQQAQAAYSFESVRSLAIDRSRAVSDHDQRLVRVWFGTHRKPFDADDISQGFSNLQSADAISYGVCNVFIPESHQPGSVGTPWWRRWLRLEADDSLRLVSTHGLPREVFWLGLANKLRTWWEPDQRNVFVLIHGYNVRFDQAAIRAAQIGFDLKVPGEMAFYSWPSQGSPGAYAADEATITASVPHIAQFLHELSTQSGAERIHLFVHSMGNRGFLSALERLVAKGYPRLRLGQVFFCAPDEDVRTFRDKATEFPHQCENRTLLISPQDGAVFLSQWKHQQDRVGYVPPVTIVPGIETIEVGGFGLLDLGHGYFASARPLIEDIREAIETRHTACNRTIPKPYDKHFMIDIREGP